VVALGLLVSVAGAPTHDEMIRAQVVFALSHNEWAQVLGTVSPYSPDWRHRVAESWLKHRVGEKFRRLEREVNDR